MSKTQPKTHAQIKRIFGLGHKLGMSDDDLRELAYDVTGGTIESLSMLSFAQANGVIKRLGGDAMSANFTPRRTRNYHNQQAGIKTIVTAAHLEKLDAEWFAFAHRTADGLARLAQRIIKSDRPRTSDECNKVIEAVKSMNGREHDAAAAAQPGFRRVA